MFILNYVYFIFSLGHESIGISWIHDRIFPCRRWVLERKLASSDVPKEEQINLIKDLERKETEFMRLRRNKICVDDFELLTIIGRGAYGEVGDMLADLNMNHHIDLYVYLCTICFS